jgi:hypothetical protein
VLSVADSVKQEHQKQALIYAVFAFVPSHKIGKFVLTSDRRCVLETNCGVTSAGHLPRLPFPHLNSIRIMAPTILRETASDCGLALFLQAQMWSVLF